ncbi:MAG TPA: molybdate ABC transporter substrate-binding protein [Actinomycetota bacterium]|nr:molybdate ABC transporter substrate-binding protein [Actinomycetota bacterium]
MTPRPFLLICVILITSACGGGTRGARDGGGPSSRLTVSAAASLTDAFTDIGEAFEDANPGVGVTLNFGPSDGLATQIVEGAPVDVFASASGTWIDAIDRDGPGAIRRTDFARNALAILVPTDDPAGIDEVDDLARDGVQLVLAAEGVPAGDLAREMLANAGIADAALANVVSNEEDVRGVVTKVLSGDADAGIAYVTDVTDDVEDEISLVEIPADVNVIATYPIAVVSGAQEEDLANRFIDFVLADGQRTLADHGFLSAP